MLGASVSVYPRDGVDPPKSGLGWTEKGGRQRQQWAAARGERLMFAGDLQGLKAGGVIGCVQGQRSAHSSRSPVRSS